MTEQGLGHDCNGLSAGERMPGRPLVTVGAGLVPQGDRPGHAGQRLDGVLPRVRGVAFVTPCEAGAPRTGVSRTSTRVTVPGARGPSSAAQHLCTASSGPFERDLDARPYGRLRAEPARPAAGRRAPERMASTRALHVAGDDGDLPALVPRFAPGAAAFAMFRPCHDRRILGRGWHWRQL